MRVDKRSKILLLADPYNHLTAESQIEAQHLDLYPTAKSAHLNQNIFFPIHKKKSPWRGLYSYPGSLLVKFWKMLAYIPPKSIIGALIPMVSLQPAVKCFQCWPTPAVLIIFYPLSDNLMKAIKSRSLPLPSIPAARSIALYPVANGPLAHFKPTGNLSVAVFYFFHIHDKIIVIRRKPRSWHPFLLLFCWYFLRGEDATSKTFLKPQ